MKNEVIDEGTKSYFNSLQNVKPLTKNEEHKLMLRYKNKNDLNARNKLITSNLRYASQMASEYRDMGMSYNELIAEANDGLIKAIDKFDISQDVKLISYAKWWIRQGIETAINKRNRLPESDLPEDRTFSAAATDGDDYEEKIDDVFAVESSGDEDKERNEFIENLLTVLTPREADILNLYYGRYGEKPKTLEEIGKKYKLTKERVRQIMEKALLKVRSKCMLADCKYLSK